MIKMNVFKRVTAVALATTMAVSFAACGTEKSTGSKTTEKEPESVAADIATNLNVIDDNYRNYYEIFVYSFCDSNGDGIGDIQGLISKLDYLNDGDDSTDTDLGVNGIWLMPVNPSTSYHKYDVMDYYDIDKAYGTLDDYKQLLKECNDRGIKVILDLVMNHSSNYHPWFKEAGKYLSTLAPGQEPDPAACKYVDYYTFSRTKESGAYYPVDGTTDWYYNAQFSPNMPDLNLNNENVRKEFEDISKYWLDMGVGGFRLDAIKEYFSDNTPANVEVLKWFSSYVKSVKPDAYIVGEAWSGDYYEYLTSGIDSVFDFNYADYSGFLANIVQDNVEDYNGKNLANCIVYSQKMIKEKNPNGIMGTFYSNHDMNRPAHYLAFDEAKIKMDIGLESLLNGSCFYYYGDEIGLGGAGDDENKRSPMIWSSTDDTGITKGPANMDSNYVINRFKSVEEQQKDDKSIWTYTRDAIKLRNIFPEIARGEVAVIEEVEDEDIFAVTKTYNDSQVIILANTSSTEEKEVTVPSDKYSYDKIRGMLATDRKPYQAKDGKIVLPPFSIVIL